MKTFLMLLFVILSTGLGSPQSSPAQEAAIDYDAYTRVLSKYVDDRGMVKYAQLKKDRSELDAFLAGTAALPRGIYEKWSEREKIAFWINVYNARTLEVIIDHYPILPRTSEKHRAGSIRQIPGAWDGISFPAAGLELTLDAVEHKILRAKFREPRIHMALVCAAYSCPPLRKEPYTGEKLDEQLEDQARRFLSQRANFYIDESKGIIHLSSVFKWFGKDFMGVYRVEGPFKEYGATEGTLLSFISGRLDEKTKALLASRKWKIRYRDYDWRLNDRSPGGD